MITMTKIAIRMGAFFALGLFAASAQAQALPTPVAQEMLARTTLLTFNDANTTGNYSVLQVKLSKPFRDQFSADRLKETFKEFAEKHIEIDSIAVKPMVPAKETAIDGDGVLRMEGYFDTAPKKVKYKLGFIRSEGEWKPVGINVTID